MYEVLTTRRGYTGVEARIILQLLFGFSPEDAAVSHTHASLLRQDDGTWVLVDHGSTNGTYVNEASDPVPANQPLALSSGDRVYLGAWTKITVELRPASVP